jgi:peptidoglycan/xylan/chitin deacetylase (PgdA/CDA1 family)
MRAGPGLRKATKLATLPLGVWPPRGADDVVILLYHRVGPEEVEIELPPWELEREIAYLASHERVRTLDDVLEAGGGGVVITFDDGTPDFHEHVVPLLERYRVPATLYLATRLAESGAGLTWDQLADGVRTRLVTVGSHTHSHADLSHASESEAREEMRKSKDLIEDHLGVACRHFAYPWAVGSPSAARVARELFRSAALHAWRTNRAGRLDPFELGRTPILRSDGRFFFEQKVRGRLDAESLAYRVLRRGPWERA